MNLLLVLRLAPAIIVLSLVKAEEIPPISSLDCPLSCVCQQYNVTCTNFNGFPDYLPASTKDFKIIDSKIPYLFANVINKLRHLQSVLFFNTAIGTIRACALSELGQLSSIAFENTAIEEIQSNAFSNIADVDYFLFTNTSVNTMHSFAFHNISHVKHLNFEQSKIGKIHPYTFQLLDHVAMVITDSSISSLTRDGFSKFTNVSVTMAQVNITDWQCGSLLLFLESSLSALKDVTITCGCSHSWIWKQPEVSDIIKGTHSVFCSNAKLPLSQAPDYAALCKDMSNIESGCPPFLPSTPHFCQRAFDGDYEPKETVGYPTYFTRNPENSVLPKCQIEFGVFLIALITLIML